MLGLRPSKFVHLLVASLVVSCTCWSRRLPVRPPSIGSVARHGHQRAFTSHPPFMVAPTSMKQQTQVAPQPLEVLAKQALIMLASSDDERQSLMEHVESNKALIGELLEEFDESKTGQLEAKDAEQLFTELARRLLEEAARNGTGAAAAHA